MSGFLQAAWFWVRVAILIYLAIGMVLVALFAWDSYRDNDGWGRHSGG